MRTRNLAKIRISEKSTRMQQVMRSSAHEAERIINLSLWKKHQLLQKNSVETVKPLGN